MGSVKSHTDFGYTDVENILPEAADSYLKFVPSTHQLDDYEIGLGLGWTAWGIALVSTALGFSQDPYCSAASCIAGIASFITKLVSNVFWFQANDPPMTDDNYTQVVEPNYKNISKIEPRNSLIHSINEVGNSSVKLEGDLTAVNNSIARRNSAKMAGDNESLIKQNEAVYNYSRMVIDDLDSMDDDTAVFENEYNKSMNEENITQIENNIQTEGISEEGRENLTQQGLNDTEIDKLEGALINLTKNQSISFFRNAFRNISRKLNEEMAVFHENIQKQRDYYNNLSQEALNETITLKNQTQNIPITTADQETLERLDYLLNEAETKYFEKKWFSAIEIAKKLKNLALETIENTLNQSYFEYTEQADKIIKDAKEKMKIDLIPSKKEIDIRAGKQEDIDLIVLSTGAPSGTYILESNNTWIIPQTQEVNVEEGKSTTVPLNILLVESFNVEPGIYPVNFTIYLEGTDTKNTVIINLTVISSRAENMVNYILYEIADLREEVDNKVSCLFDWMIINRLDDAEYFINDALEKYLNDSIPLSIVLDLLAKGNIELSDCITILLDWLSLISEEDGDFISQYLHRIRDHITLTMGEMVGTEGACKIASVEAEIDCLADNIFEHQSLFVSLSIDIHLWAASANLDVALYYMALGCLNLSKIHILLCEYELERAINTTKRSRDNGDILVGDAQMIIDALEDFIADLEGLRTHDTHEGSSGSEIPTHQDSIGGEEGSDDSIGNGGDTEDPNLQIPTH